MAVVTGWAAPQSAVSEKAQTLHRQLVVVDGSSTGFHGWNERLERSGATAINITLAAGGTDFLTACRNIEAALKVIDDNQEHLFLARSVADIRRAKRESKLAVVFNFQNGQPIESSLTKLLLFRELGVRNIQITYNERNFIGDGCTEPSNAGLSTFGREVVKAMNRWGMCIDLSHVGERTSLEAIDVSEHPCVFTHNNPRARADNLRNATDEQIKRCAEKGGVIGVCGWGPMVWTGGDAAPSVDDLVGHIQYIADLVGVDHVGIGTDSQSTTDLTYIRGHAERVNGTSPLTTSAFLAKFGNGLEFRYPAAIDHLPEVTDKLLARGWSRTDIEKVMGENLLRVWEQVWGS
jgi:membrane dipeptidase